ncbi:PEP-CTERM sorting domain-containing protein [uncultured Aquincola sp.]|uniref:PEP-CTERM sorting domain-containing protein n=1 Tax=uncultured Aquincola sp. TaxID=886556 RepID=UPI0032B1B6A9|tara:strand:+ start:4640 stop:5410 length:771 start_codon:yes stop_codon:yes gene_type:complete
MTPISTWGPSSTRTGLRWVAALWLTTAWPWAMGTTPGTCDGSSDACSFNLGRVTVTLAQGAASYNAGAEFLSGDDGDFLADPSLFSSLTLQQSGATEGFAFAPSPQLRVGGSGRNGYHQLQGFFEFTGLRFQANPGWRIDALRLEVTGQRNVVGDASWSYGLPFSLSFNGDSFVGSGALNPDDAAVRGELMVSAAYVEGEDGTAPVYGYATAAFQSARFVATVSAVPEPGTLALGLAGGAWLLGWRGRRAWVRRLP